MHKTLCCWTPYGSTASRRAAPHHFAEPAWTESPCSAAAAVTACHSAPDPAHTVRSAGLTPHLVEGGGTHQHGAAQRGRGGSAPCPVPCPISLSPERAVLATTADHIIDRPYERNRGQPLVNIRHQRGACLVPARVSGMDNCAGRTGVQLCRGGQLSGRCAGLIGGCARKSAGSCSTHSCSGAVDRCHNSADRRHCAHP